MDYNNLSSNWKKLQATLQPKSNNKLKDISDRPQYHPVRNDLKRKRSQSSARVSNQPSTVLHTASARPGKRRKSSKMDSVDGDVQNSDAANPYISFRKSASSTDGRIDHVNGGLHTSVELGKYIALDCEMVGIGPSPHLESALARISIVNYNGDCVYDSYVKPLETVTDWRTHVSGIAPKHMIDARALEEVQQEVSTLIRDRIVVGHSVRGDFEALLLSHPKKDIRDTARHPPYRKLAGGGSPKLKILASELLGLDIQTGEHSSIEDARATMLLFRRDKDAFDREHAKRWPTRVVAVREEGTNDTKKPKKKKKKKK